MIDRIVRPVVSENADLRAIGAPVNAAEGKGKARFDEAAKGLEELFMHHLVRALRATVPDSGHPSAPGADLYGSLLDEHLAAVLARDTRTGIADSIHRQLMPGIGSVPEKEE